MALSIEQPQAVQKSSFVCARCGLWLLLPLPVAVFFGVTGELLLAVSAHMGNDNRDMPFEGFLSVLPVLGLVAAFFVGGGLWGRSLARLFDLSRRLATLVGALGFALPVLAVVTILGAIEGELTEYIFDGWKMHILYGLLFVPSVFLIAAIASGALGATSGDWRLALKLALGSGVAAALAFLLVVVLMDLVGMRVGAPGAEERATMLVVTMAGMVAAALAGTWAWSRLFARRAVIAA